MKKFSKEWFENKLVQAKKMSTGKGRRLTATKGYSPDLRSQDKRQQRIEDIKRLAKEKKIRL